MTLREVAEATGGRLVDAPDETVRVTGPVEFDSRSVGPGGLFVALPGERVDGHDFAAAAVAAGAVGVLAARAVGVPAVVVDDPLAALGRLAAAVLARLPQVTVVGVTGSVGKTTTKDLIAAVLAAQGPTVAPPGSFNNEIGHPHTVLRADARTRFLVLENAARGIGHIAALCAIARPRIAAVLNVRSSHLGEFGSLDAIATAKGELIEALPDDGVAVLNADDPRVAAMARRTRARTVTFGFGAGADVRAHGVGLDQRARAGFTLALGGETAEVRLRLVGEHQVANALAAAAVAAAAGTPLATIANVLGATDPVSGGRMELLDRPDGAVIVNDAYNASPESMAAAVRALTTLAGGTRRTWAVLGAMAELGESTDAAHDELGRLVAAAGVDRLVVVGAGAARAHEAARAVAAWRGTSVQVPDAAAAIDLVSGQIAAGDVVLVKASHSAGLERVAKALATPAPARPASTGVPSGEAR